MTQEPSIGVGCGAVIQDKHGKILLMRRMGKVRNEEGTWSIPGGSVEFGERREEAVVREIKEELNCTIDVIEPLVVIDHVMIEKQQHWITTHFLCRIAEGTPENMEPEKCDAIGWFSIEEMKTMKLASYMPEMLKALQTKYPINRTIAKDRKIVTIFGASSVRPGNPRYDQAYRLGELLAEHGFTVMTGGYDGVMEALSHGAHTAKGTVIGVTCDNIEKRYKKKQNEWIGETVHTHTLKERMHQMIDLADAILVLPGGVGTLGEVGVAWAGMQAHEFPVKPLIFIGEEWKSIIGNFLSSMKELIGSDDAAIPQCAQDEAEAVALLSA